jgi:hypothetical protein
MLLSFFCRVRKEVRFPAWTPVPHPIREVFSPDVPRETGWRGLAEVKRRCFPYRGFSNNRWADPRASALRKCRRETWFCPMIFGFSAR